MFGMLNGTFCTGPFQEFRMGTLFRGSFLEDPQNNKYPTILPLSIYIILPFRILLFRTGVPSSLKGPLQPNAYCSSCQAVLQRFQSLRFKVSAMYGLDCP